MDGKLFRAACTGDLNALYDAVREDAAILRKWHSSGCTDTPLHLASIFGHINFVTEYMRLSSISPQQLSQLNQDGYNPLHLASANGHVEIVNIMLEFGKQNVAVEELCRKKDRDGRTALHCAVVNGQVDVIKMLFAVCPNAAIEVTVHRESLLHLAVKHHQFEALKFLIEKLGLEAADLLNLGDREGNTVLHLATAKRLLQIVEYLVKLPGLDVNVKNSNGVGALEMITFASALNSNDLYVDEAIRLSAGGCRSHLRGPTNGQAAHNNQEIGKHVWVKEMRSGVIVMASLIATLTFQVVLTPPGGVWQDSGPGAVKASGSVVPEHEAGTSIFYDLNRGRYNILMWINVQAFLASTSTIVGMLRPIDVTSKRYHLVLFSVYVTIIAITSEFFAILVIVTHKKLLLQPMTLIPVIVWLVILFTLLFGFALRATRIKYKRTV